MSKRSSRKSYPATYNCSYYEKGSRAELLIRIPYGYILELIAGLWGFFAVIAAVIQWFHVLVFGRMSKKLWNFIESFLRYFVRVRTYTIMLTDGRPPISGKHLPLPKTNGKRTR